MDFLQGIYPNMVVPASVTKEFKLKDYLYLANSNIALGLHNEAGVNLGV